MIAVSGKDIGTAWFNGLRHIIKKGKWQMDKYGNNTKECLSFSIMVKDPSKIGNKVKEYGDQSMISFMKNNFLKLDPIPNWGFSYGQRIFNHNGINQLDKIVNRLLKKPETRSATIDLMYPKEDNGHVPCACVLNFLIRDNKLVMNVFFRSQDIGKKFYADAICCAEIMKRVSKRIGKDIGKLTISVSSAYIYDRDINEVKDMVSYSKNN